MEVRFEGILPFRLLIQAARRHLVKLLWSQLLRHVGLRSHAYCFNIGCILVKSDVRLHRDLVFIHGQVYPVVKLLLRLLP